MYQFVGVWMGISFRTKANLPFMFPSIVWKPLVGIDLKFDDLTSIDIELSTKISKIRSISTEEEFNMQYPDLFFTINDHEEVVQFSESLQCLSIMFTRMWFYFHLKADFHGS